MIYTHSHADHFGGVKGIITDEQVAAGEVEVIAPEGFMHHAVAENVFAGTAMLRRAGYMYGAALDRGPAGQIGAGLGQTTSTGTVRLIAPTIDITHTGQTSHDRRRRDRVPDHAGHRGAGGDELLLPAAPGAVHGREHLAHAAQHPHDPRRAWCATRMPGPTT